MFLEISQNSQENTCARVSILIKILIKRLWRRCFPVKFAKFLRTSFLQNTSGLLLLNIWRYFMYFSWRVRSLLEYLFVKFRGFAINRTENYYRETAPLLPWKFKCLSRVSHFSQFFRVVSFENTPANQNMFKVNDTRANSVNAIWVFLAWLIKYF